MNPNSNSIDNPGRGKEHESSVETLLPGYMERVDILLDGGVIPVENISDSNTHEGFAAVAALGGSMIRYSKEGEEANVYFIGHSEGGPKGGLSRTVEVSEGKVLTSSISEFSFSGASRTRELSDREIAELIQSRLTIAETMIGSIEADRNKKKHIGMRAVFPFFRKT